MGSALAPPGSDRANGRNPQVLSKHMNKIEQQQFLIRLSASRGGRVLLHLGTLVLSGKHVRWHLRFILSNSMHGRRRQSDPGDSSRARKYS
jgi:hypothetical protein